MVKPLHKMSCMSVEQLPYSAATALRIAALTYFLGSKDAK